MLCLHKVPGPGSVFGLGKVSFSEHVEILAVEMDDAG